MSTLIIPPLDEEPWPSLGGQVSDWMEANLAFGPGDLLGQPYVLDDEDRALNERAYQIYPHGHTLAGRRRFDTVVVMLRKGSKKSERLGAWCAVELADDGPVRCDGFRKEGGTWVPIGRPVTDPYIPVLAFAEKQAEDTAFAALYQMLSRGPSADRFDIGIERIMRLDGDGKAEALANAPDSRDGGRTTFQAKEETHRYVLPRHKEAHQTTRANLAKRPQAQPWEAHATTAYAKGEGSVAEGMHEAARKMTPAEAKTSRMFFFYRWADARIKIRHEDGTFDRVALRDGIVEASGPVIAGWSDIDRIVQEFVGPEADPEYAERVWLNRAGSKAVMAFDVERWRKLASPAYKVTPGSLVVGGFDGSKSGDHSGLIGTEVATGFQWKVGHWDPKDFQGEIPDADGGPVDLVVDEFMQTFNVWRLNVDPPYWKDALARWAGKYGDKVVLKWETWRNRPMGFSLREYKAAMTSGAVTNDGDAEFTAHIGHCYKRDLNDRDDKGDRLWSIQKERQDSQLKIDLAVAGDLSWEARTSAIAAGAGKPLVYESVFNDPLYAI